MMLDEIEWADFSRGEVGKHHGHLEGSETLRIKNHNYSDFQSKFLALSFKKSIRYLAFELWKKILNNACLHTGKLFGIPLIRTEIKQPFQFEFKWTHRNYINQTSLVCFLKFAHCTKACGKYRRFGTLRAALLSPPLISQAIYIYFDLFSINTLAFCILNSVSCLTWVFLAHRHLENGEFASRSWRM